LTLNSKQFLAIVPVVALAGLAVACGNDNKPTGPTTVVPANASLTAPAAAEPANGAQIDSLRPTLSVNNGTSNVPGVARIYEFQIADNANFAASEASFISSYKVMVNATGIPEGANGRTSYTPNQDLQPFTKMYWRSRFLQLGQASPWSQVQTFRTKMVGFNRNGELFDPLVDGTTVGQRFGPTRFIAGKGLEVQSELGYVRYFISPTVNTGEFSVITENVRNNAGDGKNKIMAMQEGTGDLIDNDYRMTVEHRGNPAGYVAWRFISGDPKSSCSRRETVGAERRFVNMNPNRSYLWKTTWNGVFRLEIFDVAANDRIYEMNKSYCRIYRPVTHYAYIGSPVGRSGARSASKPDVIYRMVWLSSKPRPASLGTALSE
jgi:hypothetical protein